MSNLKIEICLHSSSVLSPLFPFPYIPSNHKGEKKTRNWSNLINTYLSQGNSSCYCTTNIQGSAYSDLFLPLLYIMSTQSIVNYFVAGSIGGTCQIFPQKDAAAFFMFSSLMCSHGSYWITYISKNAVDLLNEYEKATNYRRKGHHAHW